MTIENEEITDRFGMLPAFRGEKFRVKVAVGLAMVVVELGMLAGYCGRSLVGALCSVLLGQYF